MSSLVGTLAKKSDYVDSSAQLWRQIFKNKPAFTAMLSAIMQQAQDIEDALFGLQQGSLLSSATGQTLDNIGSLVGADRNGLDDATYRLFIYGQISANHGTATLQAVINLALQLFETDSLFQLCPDSIYDGGAVVGGFIGIMVGSPAVPSRLYPVIQRLLAQNIAGGVDLAFLGTFNKKGAFAFAGNQPWVRGWGSVNDATAGGPLATIVLS